MAISRTRRADPSPQPSPGATLALGDWLTLIANLPVENAAARMNALRTVESLGAAVLREGVYLLPDAPQRRASFERLARYILDGGGEVHLLQCQARDAQQEADFRARFDRSAQYAEIGKNVTSLAAAYGISEPAALARVVQRQTEEFERIGMIDFFGSPEKERVAGVLAQAEQTIRGLMFPADKEPTAEPRSRRAYFQREWATRVPLQVDRLASAWLIRRFIDAEARLTFLDKHTAPSDKAVSFGFDGAEFANTRSDITYQALLRHFGFEDDAGLARIGLLVKAITTGDASVPQATAVETILCSAMARAANDADLVAASDRTFDLLYDR